MEYTQSDYFQIILSEISCSYGTYLVFGTCMGSDALSIKICIDRFDVLSPIFGCASYDVLSYVLEFQHA